MTDINIQMAILYEIKDSFITAVLTYLIINKEIAAECSRIYK
jgi:hypothetical protein